jgi:ATP synthase I chain
MNEIPISGSQRPESEDSDTRLARRIFRVMAAGVFLAVVVSFPFANWRVTTGLLLGGTLSLFNLHWMRNSISAAFGRAPEGTRPQIRIAQYVFRYFIIGVVVYAGYKMNLVSLGATVVGLSSFVIALFFEAFRESYLIIIHREGTN